MTKGRWAGGAQGLLALLVLLVPVLDAHTDATLVPVAPGTLVATAAVHPGAAEHVETSSTRPVPRCPACDLAQQTAAALGAARTPVLAQHDVGPPPARAVVRATPAQHTAYLRGPPSP